MIKELLQNAEWILVLGFGIWLLLKQRKHKRGNKKLNFIGDMVEWK